MPDWTDLIDEDKPKKPPQKKASSKKTTQKKAPAKKKTTSKNSQTTEQEPPKKKIPQITGTVEDVEADAYEIPSGKSKAKSNHETPEIDDTDLMHKATRAQLMEAISKSKLAELKVTGEQLKVEKDVGNIIDYELAEFLFFGYMDKVNVEIGRLPRKLEGEIGKKGSKLLEKELNTILRMIKKQQKADVNKWRRER
jgi:hypothetical protein